MIKTKICKKCHQEFFCRVIVEGKTKNIYNRSYCLDCQPFNQKHETLNICLKCGSTFAQQQVINGVVRGLSKRSYCLDCSPFGGRNVSKIHLLDNTKLTNIQEQILENNK